MNHCSACRLYNVGNRCSTMYIKGSGDKHSPLMVVLDYPCRTSDYKQTPLQGKGGDLFDHVLNALGLDRSQLYITYAVKCRPTTDKWGKAKDIKPKDFLELAEDCRPYLDEEVKKVKPKALLFLGSDVLLYMSGLTGILKWEGSEVPSPYVCRSFCGLSPAYILKTPGKEVRLAQAIYTTAKAAGLKPKPSKQERIYPYEVF